MTSNSVTGKIGVKGASGLKVSIAEVAMQCTPSLSLQTIQT